MGNFCSICKVESATKTTETFIDNPICKFEENDSFYLDPDYQKYNVNDLLQQADLFLKQINVESNQVYKSLISCIMAVR